MFKETNKDNVNKPDSLFNDLSEWYKMLDLSKISLFKKENATSDEDINNAEEQEENDQDDELEGFFLLYKRRGEGGETFISFVFVLSLIFDSFG